MHHLSVNTLRNKIRNNKKLFGNTVYLYVFQLVNYILPLITIPYLVRVLGTNTFGLVAFYSSLTIYFQVVVDYGFNLSATRDVAIYKTEPKKISCLFFSILTIKIALVLICALLLMVIVVAVPRFYTEKELCFWLYCGVAGTILFPYWLFQGMEDMKFITIFNLVNRGIVSILYFVFIKSPHDYLWFAYLNTSGTFLIGILSISIAINKYKITFSLPPRAEYFFVLKRGFQIFISQISVCLFTNTNTFLLGIFSNNQVVGAYAIAEKIIRAGISFTGPVGSAIYPKTSRLFELSKEQALRFLKKIMIAGACVFFLLSLCLFVFAEILVLLVSGVKSAEIAFLVRIMAILPLSVFLDNIFGTQIMLNNRLQKQFMFIIFIGGMFSVVLLMILVPPLNGIGSAISFVFSEVAILLAMIIAVRKKGIRIMASNEESKTFPAEQEPKI
jgi:polysaccharide transporter, PST family